MTRRSAATALVLVLIAACAGEDRFEPSVSCQGTVPPPGDLGRSDRVVIVTVDGMRPELISPEIAPTLSGMLRSSVRSMSASTTSPPVTLPSHVAMITGLPPEEHGVLWNRWEPERGPLAARTVFGAASEAGLSSGLFAGKKKLRHLATPAGPDVVRAADRDDVEVMEEARAFLRATRPALSMIHLAGVDLAGHADGWLGEEQRRAMSLADEQITRLLETLAELDADGSRSVVIVTSDHGGAGRTHRSGRPEDLTVPWIVWGSEAEPREIPPVCVSATATVAAGLLGLRFEPGLD